MSRAFIALLVVTVMTTVSAQPSQSNLGARGAMFDLVMMLTAIQERETTSDVILGAEQAAALRPVLQELQEAEALTPDNAETTLSAIESILTPKQLIWVDMRMLEPPAPQAEDSEARGFLGRLLAGDRRGDDRPQGDWEARRAALEAQGGLAAREGLGASAMRGGQGGAPQGGNNPFSRPPLSNELEAFIEALNQKVTGDAGN